MLQPAKVFDIKSKPQIHGEFQLIGLKYLQENNVQALRFVVPNNGTDSGHYDITLYPIDTIEEQQSYIMDVLSNWSSSLEDNCIKRYELLTNYHVTLLNQITDGYKTIPVLSITISRLNDMFGRRSTEDIDVHKVLIDIFNAINNTPTKVMAYALSVIIENDKATLKDGNIKKYISKFYDNNTHNLIHDYNISDIPSDLYGRVIVKSKVPISNTFHVWFDLVSYQMVKAYIEKDTSDDLVKFRSVPYLDVALKPSVDLKYMLDNKLSDYSEDKPKYKWTYMTCMVHEFIKALSAKLQDAVKLRRDIPIKQGLEDTDNPDLIDDLILKPDVLYHFASIDTHATAVLNHSILRHNKPYTVIRYRGNNWVFISDTIVDIISNNSSYIENELGMLIGTLRVTSIDTKYVDGLSITGSNEPAYKDTDLKSELYPLFHLITTGVKV